MAAHQIGAAARFRSLHCTMAARPAEHYLSK